VQSPASEAAASAEASVTQHSLVAAGLIRYASEASASASGFAAPAAQYDAHAYGLSSMFVEFSVGAPLAVYLTLESDAGGPDDFFGFALQREGVIVWDAEQVADPLTGGANGSFRRLLVLQPGLYSVSADLQTSAVGGGLDHAFASAAFSLSPAPDPETWLLMLAGLGCVGALVRRRRRAAAA
jgi:hypothetical protein